MSKPLWILRTDQREIVEVRRRPDCPALQNLLRSVVLPGLGFFKTRRRLAIEVLALRHQLGVLKRSVERPRLTNADRGLWVLLSRRWANRSDGLTIVKSSAHCGGSCSTT